MLNDSTQQKNTHKSLQLNVRSLQDKIWRNIRLSQMMLDVDDLFLRKIPVFICLWCFKPVVYFYVYMNVYKCIHVYSVGTCKLNIVLVFESGLANVHAVMGRHENLSVCLLDSCEQGFVLLYVLYISRP